MFSRRWALGLVLELSMDPLLLPVATALEPFAMAVIPIADVAIVAAIPMAWFTATFVGWPQLVIDDTHKSESSKLS